MLLRILTTLIFLMGSCPSLLHALEPNTCLLEKVSVARKGSKPLWIGEAKTKTVEIVLQPESPASEPPLFNRPLIAKMKTSAKRCQLGEGLWDPGQIYLDQNQEYLAATESSGSSVSFNIYLLSACKKIGEMDVSGPKFEVSGDKVIYPGVCEYLKEDKSLGHCTPAAVYSLNNICKPQAQEKESLELTKKNFGVEFTKSGQIEHPHTPKAKALP